MVIREYGTENSKNLVFFQGSCEPWEEFRPAAEGLAKALMHREFVMMHPEAFTKKALEFLQ